MSDHQPQNHRYNMCINTKIKSQDWCYVCLFVCAVRLYVKSRYIYLCLGFSTLHQRIYNSYLKERERTYIYHEKCTITFLSQGKMKTTRYILFFTGLRSTYFSSFLINFMKHGYFLYILIVMVL